MVVALSIGVNVNGKWVGLCWVGLGWDGCGTVKKCL